MRLSKYVDDVTEEESFELDRRKRSHSFYFFDLSEIFNDRPSTTISTGPDNIFGCRFRVHGIVYVFQATLLSPVRNTWGLLFYNNDDRYSPDDIFSSKGDTMLPIKVFAGVLECLDVLMKHRTVGEFYFESTDDRLKRFYTKMVPYIKREYPKYSRYVTTTVGSAKTFMFSLPEIGLQGDSQ